MRQNQKGKDFIQKTFMSTENLPFSFKYKGKPSSEIMGGFEMTFETKEADAGAEHCFIYRCKETGLCVTCSVIEYSGFDAVDWTLYFGSESAVDTPIISDVLPLDAELTLAAGNMESHFCPELHYYTGSPCTAGDFEPHCDSLQWGVSREIKTSGGRSSNAYMPYFTLQGADNGVAMAIGWPGQWAAGFAHTDRVYGISAKAGQEDTHFTVYPGETLRSPRIVLLFYSGDFYDGQNLWRRFMRAHNQPKAFGREMQPQISACHGNHYPGIITNAETEMKYLANYPANGIKIDYWWEDAGWYICDDNWPKVGTWETDPRRFPKGLREVTDFCHDMGVNSLVWFEPERVAPGTWIYENKPEWVTTLNEGEGGLLRLDIDECREWITGKIGQILRDNKIDVYRQDFNIDPLMYWKKLDAPNRRGVSEIKHITAYLRFWDDLIAANNGMYIDTCASGGRRLDIETLKRSVSLLRSDYTFNADSNQGQTYGLSFLVPFNGTGELKFDEYSIRSLMVAEFTVGLDSITQTPDYETIRRLIREWRTISPVILNGDYYPLTPYSIAPDGYMAWQFHHGDKGCVQAFRRADCKQMEAVHKLRGLDPDTLYKIENFDGGALTMTGKQLAEEGLCIRIESAPKAMIFYYSAACGIGGREEIL
ncbi:MAG: alpha-galactosidase [Oscillospiraceae bacterium]|nr:alpha-galactosidase [Oscillospiraceae bacterium]